MKTYSLFFLIAISTIACTAPDKKVMEADEYSGPIFEQSDVRTFYSDSAKVMLKMEAPLQYNYINGDKEFPEGLYMEFYDKLGAVTTTMRCDYCIYDGEEKVWKATGDVEIESFKENQKLNTEELNWDPAKEKVYTDKFVRIETDNEILMGEGLEAAQDFSTYSIKKVRGSIPINEQMR
ncbi:MAG TPA: LPS export ABC transporter periplasmic protein LptC [Cytophagales bacterium]|jgi:LPS export ABC transporter protein LptC|nr:LPS export ABC transporter periplasmic protein LptC [Cytophagales bacterium]